MQNIAYLQNASKNFAFCKYSDRYSGKKAKLMCKSIADTRYAIDDIKTGQILSNTISIGISVYQTGDTAHSVIEPADQALYVAKDNGKNHVVAEDELSVKGVIDHT